MADFVALYRGQTVAEAELVALSAEKHLVRRFFTELFGESQSERETNNTERRVPILEAIQDE